MNKLEQLIKTSKMATIAMKENLEDNAYTRWQNKEVYKRLCIYNSNNIDNVSLHGLATIDLSSDIVVDNNMSLHFTANTKVENVIPRPFPSIKIKLDSLNLEEYNRISLKVYPKSTGHVNFYYHFGFGDEGAVEVHAPSLTPNMWNTVLFEIDKISRKEV